MSLKNLFSLDIDFKSRIYGFDIMRGIGMLIVMVTHGRSIIISNLYASIFLSMIAFWIVDSFFVQSGFLIGTMLIKSYERKKDFNITVAYDFWIRRWFRTLPNYFFVLILSITIYGLFGHFFLSNPRYFSYFVFSQNLFTPHPAFIQEVWTLCVEEWFYLLLPLLLILFHFIYRNKETTVIRRNFLFAIAVLFIFPTFCRFLASIKDVSISWDDLSRMTIFRLDTIAFGIFAAWINFYYPHVFVKYRNRFTIIGFVLFGLFAAIFCTLILKIVPGNIIINPLSHSPLILTFSFTLSALSCFFILPFWKGLIMKKLTFLSKFITVISVVSYSIYIFHRSVVLFLIKKVFHDTPSFKYPPVFIFILYFVLTILFSILVYKYFEHPITEMREKFMSRKSKA